MNYYADSVDVLISSKKGEEEKKTSFSFYQGSLPVSLKRINIKMKESIHGRLNPDV